MPSAYVWKRTAVVALIAALISISFSTGIRLILGVQSDWITIIVRLILPFVIATPLGIYWFSRLEKLEHSYRNAVKRANELARVASVDPMTGILNRRSFIEQFDAARSAGIRGWFLMVDIDYLKQINDQHGHLVGDDAVISVAEALVMSLPADSLVARIGGDEFCSFVPRMFCKNIGAVVDNIGSTASALFEQKQPDAKHILSVSVGHIVSKPKQKFKDIMLLADNNLYRKKDERG